MWCFTSLSWSASLWCGFDNVIFGDNILFIVFQAQLRASVFLALEEQEKVQVNGEWIAAYWVSFPRVWSVIWLHV